MRAKESPQRPDDTKTRVLSLKTPCRAKEAVVVAREGVSFAFAAVNERVKGMGVLQYARDL